MFLEKINKLFKKISFKLAISFLVFFIPTYWFIFAAFDYLATRDLKKRDREQIENQMVVYQEIIEKDGIDGLKKAIQSPKQHHHALKYLVYLTDKAGHSLFFHSPEDVDQIPEAYVLEKLKSLILKKESYNHWKYIASPDGDENSIEIRTDNIDGQYDLTVGASTDLRDDLLEKFKEIFIAILTPLIFISVFGAIFISQRILSPLETLNDSIEKIKKGRLSTRSPLPKSKDELYDLTTTFNGMVDQIDKLITAMKETLDNIAHDLKTPLTRNRMVSELALQSGSFVELSSAAEENIENTDSMLKMVHTIMDVARLDTQTLKLNKEIVSTHKIIEEVIDLYYFVAEEKNILLKSDLVFVDTVSDKLMMRQAIANLIDNAIKYSNSGSEVVIKTKQTLTHFEFSIQDHGIGVSQEDISRIWERLYRADRSRHQPGLGLGLSMVKIFIDSHKGKVDVISQLGVGTEIKFVIPKT